MFVSSKLKNIYKEVLLLNIFILISSNRNILIFDSNPYIYGHSAFTKNGDLIIEYSYEDKRLFYGIKKNGKNYFKENGTSVQTKSLIIENNDSDNTNRYQSRNIH